MGGRLVRIDPETLEHEVLGAYPGIHGATALSGADIYGLRGKNLLRLNAD